MKFIFHNTFLQFAHFFSISFVNAKLQLLRDNKNQANSVISTEFPGPRRKRKRVISLNETEFA